jgi:predicted flap endonuclease-1-like 5' DNA nuclease
LSIETGKRRNSMATTAKIKELLRSHEAIMKEAEKAVRESTRKQVEARIPIAEKEGILDRYKERLEGIKNNRKAAIKTYDAEIKAVAERIKAIEGAIEADKKVLEENESALRGLEALRGIGDVYAHRLMEAGVRNREDLGNMKPSKVARILEVSEERATALIKKARKAR